MAPIDAAHGRLAPMRDETSPDTGEETAELIIEALSRADGRNSTIRIYPDRIEWIQTQSISSMPRPIYEPPVIPMPMVISVKAKKDGPLFSKVLLRTFTQTLVFRMYAPQAVAVRNAINALLAARPRELGPIPPPAPPAPPLPPPSPPPPPEPGGDELLQLRALLIDGIITYEEFEVAKAQLPSS